MEYRQLSTESRTQVLDEGDNFGNAVKCSEVKSTERSEVDLNLSTSQYAIAALKESNKILAFDLEKTRLWAIAAQEELEQAKGSVKDLLEEIHKIKEHMHTLIAEKDKAIADLAASEAEKAILLEIVNTS
jgi:hypothetical protein